MEFFKNIKNAVTPTRTAAPASTSTLATKAAAKSEPVKIESVTKPPRLTAPTARKKHVLFVSADSGFLGQLGQSIKHLALEWDLSTATNRVEVLELAGQGPIDAIVCDGQVGDVSGPELLNELIKVQEKIVRFMRCATTERDLIKRCTGQAPRMLAPDFDAATLESAVKTAFRLEDFMSHEPIKRLVSQMHRLPSLPELYNQISAELNSPSCSMEFVAKLIAKDPVMTAKILQVVNSAFFALSRQITSPVDAVMFLGGERTKSLVLIAHVFTQFDKGKCPGFSLDQLWQHSMATGTQARVIAHGETKNTRIADMAFTAGLLHDVGKLLLAFNVPEQYGRVARIIAEKNCTAREAEQEIFATTHCQLGACLLAIWGLPLPLIDAVAYHHEPSSSDDQKFTVLTAVHASNALAYEKKHGPAGVPGCTLDQTYIARLGLAHRRNIWREVCGCPLVPDEA